MKQKYVLSKTLKVGVLCGGDSSERVISLKSGRAIYKALKKLGFKTFLIDPAALDFKKRLKSIDVAFLALHGKGGEDGGLQALLSRLKIPFTGSDARGCERSFDKTRSKRIFVKKGIPTPKSIILKKARGLERRIQKWRGPAFIKPPEEGSSIGAFSIEDLAKNAVKVTSALSCYSSLLIEAKIEGREFTVGILGRQALPVIELKPRRSFYDYKAKYTKGMTKYLVPAPIPELEARKLQRLAKKVHKVLGLRDMSRIDIMVDQKGKPFVLEANAIPGFTELSLLPKAAKKAGISFENLCYELIRCAYARR